MRELKDLQDVLGTFQDCEVQQHEIRVIATDMMASHDVPATALLAMGDLSAQVGRRERRARGEFASRFAAFASQPTQARFRALATDLAA